MVLNVERKIDLGSHHLHRRPYPKVSSMSYSLRSLDKLKDHLVVLCCNKRDVTLTIFFNLDGLEASEH